MIEAPRGAFVAASVFAWMIDKMGSLADGVYSAFRSVDSPDDCKTAADLRAYAYSIMKTQPALAKELLAAADRTEEETETAK